MKLVDRPEDLAEAAAALGGTQTFYVDTEFESKRSGTTLSVIQVSAGRDIYLIDALSLDDLAPLASVMGAQNALWVLHAGLQDVELLCRELGLGQPPRLFDTQVAWALVGPEAGVSLAYLEYKLLGHRKMKTHQADDWMRRPLPKPQLEYAAEDIEHLPALHEGIGQRLRELDREAVVEEATREQLLPDPEPEPRVTIHSFRNAWQLDRKSQAALSFMIGWYNDLSPNERAGALPPKSFLSVASRRPRSPRDLSRIKGVPFRWSQKKGKAFVSRLTSAIDGASHGDFTPIDPPPYATYEGFGLDAWLASMRAKVCERLSLAPDLAFNARLMKRIRQSIEESGDRRDGAELLAGWRRRLLRDEYLACCERD